MQLYKGKSRGDAQMSSGAFIHYPSNHENATGEGKGYSFQTLLQRNLEYRVSVDIPIKS